MKISYTSLFPKNPVQHEYKNLDYFIESSKFYNINHNFSFSFFSGHDEPLDYLKSIYGMEYKYGKVDFKYFENMNEERGHEISFCKASIFNHNIVLHNTYDYLFFTDSDIRIDSKDIYNLCNILEQNKKENKETFINIPYVLRNLKKVSPASFGCYIIPSSILKDNPDLWEVIYNTQIVDDKLCRIGAPDCNVRNALLNRGYKELVARTIYTRHYTSDTSYIEYDNEKCKEVF